MGKLTRYLLKEMLGINAPQKGKDLGNIIYLDPLQAQEGGKGQYVHRRRSKELMVTIPPGIKEDWIERDGRRGQEWWRTR